MLLPAYDVCEIVCQVHMATFTPSDIQSAFRRCGIHGFNPDVISNSAIAPSIAFSKPAQEQISAINVADSTADITDSIQIICDQSARSSLEKQGSSMLQKEGTAKVRKPLSKVVGGHAFTVDRIFHKIKGH